MSIFNRFARKDINEGVRQFRESGDAVLLDVRTREEYASGHIEDSRNVPSSVGKISDNVKRCLQFKQNGAVAFRRNRTKKRWEYKILCSYRKISIKGENQG